MIAVLVTLFALQGAPTRVPRSAQQSVPAAPSQGGAPPARAPATTTSPRSGNGAVPGQQGTVTTPVVPPKRFGRFDLDAPKDQLAKQPDLKDCADALAAPYGHADCPVPAAPDRIARVQIAWEDSKPGGEIVALRLLFDPQTAPPLTELEWQLTRGWGAPSLEQLRREKDQKLFTLQWEDAEHRATLEAQGALAQPSRAIAVVLERRPLPLPPDLVGLRPRPFPGMRFKLVRRLEWDGQPYAVVWGTSLAPSQEALGETGPAWATQRGYVGLWKLEAATQTRPRRWRALWERGTGDEDEDNERISRVDTRDVTGDGVPDVEVELSCETCGRTASEVLVKTVRAGKLVDLFYKRDLFRAQVDFDQGRVRIREPDGDEDQGTTVSTYSYDRGKGAFVLAREERVSRPNSLPPER
jgi:hypothetical protein